MKEYIEKIREELVKNKNVKYAFLFGSTLKNQISEESDVDILIEADLTPFERIDLAMELELVVKRKVDLVLVKEASCELILNAFSKGVPVLVNDKEKLEKDYFRNFRLFEDNKPLRELKISKIKRRYAYGG